MGGAGGDIYSMKDVWQAAEGGGRGAGWLLPATSFPRWQQHCPTLQAARPGTPFSLTRAGRKLTTGTAAPLVGGGRGQYSLWRRLKLENGHHSRRPSAALAARLRVRQPVRRWRVTGVYRKAGGRVAGRVGEPCMCDKLGDKFVSGRRAQKRGAVMCGRNRVARGVS